MHTLHTKDIISYALMVLSLIVCGTAANWSAVVWILACGATYFYLCRCMDELAALKQKVEAAVAEAHDDGRFVG